MNCMKCGKETQAGQLFCDACLVSMEDYPVKPGTPVHLPPRPANEKPAPRIREESPAETIRGLRVLIRWLTALILLLSVLLCATAGFLIHALDKQADSSAIGRNYTTNTSRTNP